MKIGLFFGSFNPLHIGHKIIASYMVEFTEIDKVWFILSPQNPLKKKQSLLDQHHRLMIIRMEIEDNPKLHVSDVEFHLSQPNYTIDTLLELGKKYPKNEFSLIIGGDNFLSFHKWKNYKQILKNYWIYVYPRPGNKINSNHHNIRVINNVPQMDISASFIRRSIKEGKDISSMIPEKAWHYIDDMNFYK